MTLIEALCAAKESFVDTLSGTPHKSAARALQVEADRLTERADSFPQGSGAGNPAHLYTTRANAMRIASDYLDKRQKP